MLNLFKLTNDKYKLANRILIHQLIIFPLQGVDEMQRFLLHEVNGRGKRIVLDSCIKV